MNWGESERESQRRIGDMLRDDLDRLAEEFERDEETSARGTRRERESERVRLRDDSGRGEESGSHTTARETEMTRREVRTRLRDRRGHD